MRYWCDNAKCLRFHRVREFAAADPLCHYCQRPLETLPDVREYKGDPADWSVTVDGKPLPLRLDIANHSPTGFAWGYQGSGPAQLALALLADHLGPGREHQALEYHQRFKAEYIARLGGERRWRITTLFIDDALRHLDTQAALSKANGHG